MATPTAFSTINTEGIDVNAVYQVSASVTPETPAPPFLLGQNALGSNGTQYLFCQASTSITAYDWVVIKNTGQANSMTSTNVVASTGVRIGVAPGGFVSASLSTALQAGSYFWAAINGSQVKGNAGANTAGYGTGGDTGSGIILYTSLTAGVVASVSLTSSVALGGVAVAVSGSPNPVTFTLSWPRAIQLSGVSTPVNPLGFF